VNLSIRHLLAFFLQFGVFGLLLLAIADDSFLFLPIGSDLLTVLLVARHHDQLPICVLAAATGSTIGVFLLDLVCRRGGEEGLKRLVKPKLLGYLKQQMEKHAAAALIVSCLAPPPFPFGASIATASAFQYPRPHLLAWSSLPAQFDSRWSAGPPSISDAGSCGSRTQPSLCGSWAFS